ncbi:MAG TPA: AI-2E family transporter [Longimicrobium sp.]|nr:AI-2E family transporter [Longimicrobium sp.]
MTDSQPEVIAPAPTTPQRGERVRTVAVVLIAVTLTFAGLYFARGVFIPIGMALVFTALLRPVVRALEKLRVPTGVAATIVMLGMLAALAGAAIAVATPVQGWMRQAPQSIKKAQEKLRDLVPAIGGASGVMGGATKEAKGSDQPASGQAAPGQAASSGSAPPAGGAQQEQSSSGEGKEQPSFGVSNVAARAFGVTTGLLTSLLEVLLLTWFLLASGTMFIRKLVHVLPHISEKKRAVEVVHESESVVSRYLVVSLLINIGQGIAVGLAMWGLGMPSPVLWGILAALLEFIPYLGGMIMVLLLTLMGLGSFDETARALMAPGAYLLITTVQNNLVSPFAYGSRLKLNPVAVLVAVMVWYALWGVAGAFLAVPIVATIKVLADRIPSLHAIGEFLGE